MTVEEQYRNMKEILDHHPTVVEHAREAIRRAGLEPRMRPIRGGTDGSRLSFMGLPTPNIFAGEHNFHSRLEWVSVQDMEKAVEVIVHLPRLGRVGVTGTAVRVPSTRRVAHALGMRPVVIQPSPYNVHRWTYRARIEPTRRE